MEAPMKEGALPTGTIDAGHQPASRLTTPPCNTAEVPQEASQRADGESEAEAQPTSQHKLKPLADLAIRMAASYYDLQHLLVLQAMMKHTAEKQRAATR